MTPPSDTIRNAALERDVTKVQNILADLRIVDGEIEGIGPLSYKIVRALSAGEPIAWQFRHLLGGEDWSGWCDLGAPVEDFRRIFGSNLKNGTTQLRQFYAAPPSLENTTNHDHYNSNLVTAGQAYQMADAMLRARAQGES